MGDHSVIWRTTGNLTFHPPSGCNFQRDGFLLAKSGGILSIRVHEFSAMY